MADYDDPRPSSQPTGSTEGAVGKDNLITLDRIMTAPTGTEITNRKGEALTPMVDIVGDAQAIVQAAVDAVAADTIENTASISTLKDEMDAAELRLDDIENENSVTVSNSALELTQTGAELQTILNDSASILKAASLAAGCELEQIILATDTTTLLDDILYIYDAGAQVTYAKPSTVGAGEVIVSFVDGVLTTDVAGYNAILTSSTDKTVHVSNYSGNASDYIQEAIKKAYETGANMKFKSGETYELDKAIFWNSYGDLDLGMTVFAEGVTFKLTAETSGGGVINFGRGADVGNGDAIERTGMITWFGGTIDGNSIAGENGWSCARLANVEFHNIRAINCKRDYVGTREGGRGFTAHPRCKNVTVFNYNGVNCSDYIHASHVGDHLTDENALTTITNITQAAQAVMTVSENGFVAGDFVYIYNVSGMTEINPGYTNSDMEIEVLSVDGLDVTLDLDTAAYSAYTSGGNVLLADTTSGGRTPSINFYGGLAENCEYSFINIEGANQPRSTKSIQAVGVHGAVGVNCGTTASRGAIVGSNACRLICDVTLINKLPLWSRSVVKGSFQSSDIKVRQETDSITYIIDALPTVENPTGTGIDAGYPVFPYGASFDNEYDIRVKYTNSVTSGIDCLINVDDTDGDIKKYYRNQAKITMTGLADDTGMGSDFTNTALHETNFTHIVDSNLGREFSGKITEARTFTGGAGESELSGDYTYDTGVSVQGVTFAGVKVKNDTGNQIAEMRYQISNNRWYMFINNASAYQFTSTAIMPSTDGGKSIGVAGLAYDALYLKDEVTDANYKISMVNGTLTSTAV